MTHVDENAFQMAVKEHLVEQHGKENVVHEPTIRLPDGSVRYPDFWVHVGDVRLAIEVENDAGSIRAGTAQAREYAKSDPRAVPVVYVPESHTQNAAVDFWRDEMPIIEL